MTAKYTQGREVDEAKVYKGRMNLVHKLLYEFVNECVMSRSMRKNEATALDLEAVELKCLIRIYC